MPRKLWEHSDPDSTHMAQFMRDVNKRRGLQLKVNSDGGEPFHSGSLNIMLNMSMANFSDFPRSLQMVY